MWQNLQDIIITFVVSGGLATLVTLKATKKKSNAEAISAEIRNLRDVLEETRKQNELDRQSFKEDREYWKSEKEELIAKITILNKQVEEFNARFNEMNEKLKYYESKGQAKE